MFQKFGSNLPQSLIDAASSITEAKVEPAKPDAEAIARRKRLQALKDKQEDDAAEKSYKTDTGVRKVAGSSYGGAKQKDDDVNEEVEELDEISKSTYVSAMRTKTDPNDTRGNRDSDEIVNRAKKYHGDKFAKQLSNVGKSHWPKTYGKDDKEVKQGHDKLQFRKNRSTDPNMVTKSGKLTKTAQKGLKSQLSKEEYEEEFNIVEFVEYINEMDESQLDEMINEVLGKSAKAGDWIHDFVHSDNPKFAGKSKAQRKKMALAAYYGKQRNEELKGNQHKIDANKNGKVDAHDFKILRAKKKVNEESDNDLVEGTQSHADAFKSITDTMKSGTKKYVGRMGGKEVHAKKDAQGNVKFYNRDGISGPLKRVAEETELELILDLTEGKDEDDVPFDADKKPKKSAVAGKQGYGPSVAKHLARLGLKGAQKKKTNETLMGKAATSEEVVDERVMTPGTGTSPDPLVARTGISRDLKKPAEKDRAVQNLKTAIKSTVKNKEHGKSKLPEETEIEESRGHKIIARKLADIDRRSQGTAPDYHDNAQTISDKLKDKHNTDKVEIVTQKDTSASSQKPDMSHMDDKQDLNKKRHGYGNVVHSEETELDEVSAEMLGRYSDKANKEYNSPDGKKKEQRKKGLVTAYLKAKGRARVPATYKEEVELDETAALDQYIKSMGYDPEHTPKDKKVMFSKTNAFKTWASSRSRQESKTPGQDDDNHMSPGATARG